MKANPNLKGRQWGRVDPGLRRGEIALSGIGEGSSGEVFIELFYDDENHKIMAITLGTHPIVGFREWKVEGCCGQIVITTNAVERRSGYRAEQGFWDAKPLWSDGGLIAMIKLWNGYLENLAKNATANGTKGSYSLAKKKYDDVREVYRDNPSLPPFFAIPMAKILTTYAGILHFYIGAKQKAGVGSLDPPAPQNREAEWLLRDLKRALLQSVWVNLRDD